MNDSPTGDEKGAATAVGAREGSVPIAEVARSCAAGAEQDAVPAVDPCGGQARPAEHEPEVCGAAGTGAAPAADPRADETKWPRLLPPLSVPSSGTTGEKTSASDDHTVVLAPKDSSARRPRTSGPPSMVLVATVLGMVAGGLAGGLVAVAVVAPPAATPAAGQAEPSDKGSVEWTAQRLTASVVQLTTVTGKGSVEGSGFVFDAAGHVLTNNHVVEAAADGSGHINVLFHNGDRRVAGIVGRDPTTDIAVLRVPDAGGLRAAELGRSAEVAVGQQVVAMGSPFALSGTVTSGIVSALHRPVRARASGAGEATVMDAIQTDAAINPGNSGGPLADLSGKVIAINSAIYAPSSSPDGGEAGANVGIGFAIPIDQARRTAEEIVRTGQATQTYIGANVDDAPDGGARVGFVQPGTPAAAAGLKVGDVIVKIDDRPVGTSDVLIAAIRTKAPGELVRLVVRDRGDVRITLGGQPVRVS